MAKLSAGVIGLGVGEKHAGIYDSDNRSELVAICDFNPEKLSEVHKKFPSARCYTDPMELISSTDITLVSIASYDNYHAEQVLACLQNNKHVYVEKPLCLHHEELYAISETLRKKELQLSSNLVLRTFPQFRSLREKIQSGELGEIYHIEGDYNYGRLEKITQGWRGEIPFYSVSHGGGIHLIDLIRWLTDDPVLEVISTGTKKATAGTQYKFPDTICSIAKTRSGATIKICSNYSSVTPHHHALSVFGTKGTFIRTMKDGFFCFSRDTKEGSNKGGFVPAEASLGSTQKELSLTSFIDVLSGEKDPALLPFFVSSEDVFSSMAVSLAIEKSLETRQWEQVEYNSIEDIIET